MPVQFPRSKALDSLNLTPLIDVVFLLLIFFLVATRIADEERELDVTLPQASDAQPLIAKPKELLVNVTAEGQYYVNGEILNVQQLQQALKQAWHTNPGRQKVVIRADKESKTKHIALVMNLCNQAKIRDYTLATEGITK